MKGQSVLLLNPSSYSENLKALPVGRAFTFVICGSTGKILLGIAPAPITLLINTYQHFQVIGDQFGKITGLLYQFVKLCTLL